MIVGILGFAGSGKDTAARFLVEHGGVPIGFADALKRMVRDLFKFNDEQMWGSQAVKEAVDRRYPREHTFDDTGKCACCGVSLAAHQRDHYNCYLTPRYAMQIFGTEAGRHCYPALWIDKAIEVAHCIEQGFGYRREFGAWAGAVGRERIAVFIDCRFKNEVAAIQRAGGRVYRLIRPNMEAPPFNHPSETEQLEIPDDKLQGVINNDGTLEDLKEKVLKLVQE